jgi:hypothetical protein
MVRIDLYGDDRSVGAYRHGYGDLIEEKALLFP